jgi:NADPH2:quinone reductase
MRLSGAIISLRYASGDDVRAARCNEYGPPESVVVEELPTPDVGPGQVLVDVRAASVNYPDVLLIANKYQVSMPTPFTPGSELAGVVAAVADDVDTVNVGDRVFGSSWVGAFAEQAVVGAAGLTVMPDGVDFPQAAAFGVVYITAYNALRSVAETKPGDWVVVLGAAGGVGTASVEVAQLLGGRVLAAASSDEKLALCRKLGAEAVVNYETEDLKERIKEITSGGADVVIDPVGGKYSEPALRATRWGGRFVVVGFASGEIPRIPLNLVLLKGPIVKGFEVRTFSEYAPTENARDRVEAFTLFAEGKLRPHVSEIFPLDRVGDALRAVSERRALGKVIVSP